MTSVEEPDQTAGVEPDVTNVSSGSATLAPASHEPATLLVGRWRVADPAVGPWLLALCVLVVYGAISVAQYLRLGTYSWDLGIFTEAVKQYSHLRAPIVDIRQPGLDILGDHVDPVIALVAPFFRVFPTPVTLLVAQALLVAVSVVPVTRLAVRRLGTGSGYGVGIAYGFAWGLQTAIAFDFHEVAFAVPLLALSLTALVDQRYPRAMLWSLPLIVVMEDQGLTVAMIGLYITMAHRPSTRDRILATMLALVGVSATMFCVLWVVPHFNPSGQSPYWQFVGVGAPRGGHGLATAIGSMARHLFAHLSQKLPTLFLILLPTGFLALRSPLVLIAVPAIALRAVSTYSGYWGTSYHYNATVMPIVFVAAIDGIIRLRARAGRAEGGAGYRLGQAMAAYGAVAMLAMALPLANQFALKALWTPDATFGVPARAHAAAAAMARVPDGATVETTLDLLAPLAARTDTFWIGNTNPPPEYVVFDSRDSGWTPPPADPLAFVEQRHDGVAYTRIYGDRDGLEVFRRRGVAPAPRR